jgi:hypothetical protein
MSCSLTSLVRPTLKQLKACAGSRAYCQHHGKAQFRNVQMIGNIKAAATGKYAAARHETRAISWVIASSHPRVSPPLHLSAVLLTGQRSCRQ